MYAAVTSNSLSVCEKQVKHYQTQPSGESLLREPRLRWQVILRLYHGKVHSVCGVHSSVTGYGPLSGFCGHQLGFEFNKGLFTFLRRILFQSARLLFCYIILSGMHRSLKR